MKVPIRVCVLGEWIPVHYVDNIVEGRDQCDGLYCPSKAEIKIDKSLSHDRMKQVLTHEIMHAVMDISGITDFISAKQEEAICKAVERGFASLAFSGKYVKWKEL